MNKPTDPVTYEERRNRNAFWTSMKLNAWLALATGYYLVTLFVLKHHAEWSPSLKVVVTLSPILPGLLWVRSGLRMLGTLDELQRRKQLEAWLFAALGTVVVHTIVNVLTANGLGWENYPHGLQLGGTYMAMFFMWCAGTVMANLRYR